jgi:hypothetical protein
MRKVIEGVCPSCKLDKFLDPKVGVCSSCLNMVVINTLGMIVRRNTRPNPTQKLGPSYLTGRKKPSGYTRLVPKKVINPRFYRGRSSQDSAGDLDSRTDA